MYVFPHRRGSQVALHIGRLTILFALLSRAQICLAARLLCLSLEPAHSKELSPQSEQRSLLRLAAIYIESARSAGTARSEDSDALLMQLATAYALTRALGSLQPEEPSLLAQLADVLDHLGRSADAALVRRYRSAPHFHGPEGQSPSLSELVRQVRQDWATGATAAAIELMLIRYAQGVGPEAIFNAAEFYRHSGCTWEALALFHGYQALSHHPDYLADASHIKDLRQLQRRRALAEQWGRDLRDTLFQAQHSELLRGISKPAELGGASAGPGLASAALDVGTAMAPRLDKPPPHAGSARVGSEPENRNLFTPHYFDLKIGFTIVHSWLRFAGSPDPQGCAQLESTLDSYDAQLSIQPQRVGCPSSNRLNLGLAAAVRVFVYRKERQNQRHRLSVSGEASGVPTIPACQQGCGSSVLPQGHIEGAVGYDVLLLAGRGAWFLAPALSAGIGYHYGLPREQGRGGAGWPSLDLLYAAGRIGFIAAGTCLSRVQLALDSGLSFLFPAQFSEQLTTQSLRLSTDWGLGPVSSSWGIRPDLSLQLTIRPRWDRGNLWSLGLQLSMEHIELRYRLGAPELGNSILDSSSLLPTPRHPTSLARLLATSSTESTMTLALLVGVHL